MSWETFSAAFSVVGLLVAAISVWLGYRAVDQSFRRGVYTQASAPQLLHDGNVSGWNAFRRLNPDWQPTLNGHVFDDLVLPEVDLRSTHLAGASFKRAILDGADFSLAVLTDAVFDNASLRRAAMDGATLAGASFNGATVDELSVKGAALAQTSFENAQGHTRHQHDITTPTPRTKPDVAALSALSPREFEALVAELLTQFGYRVEVTPPTRDGGVDIVASQETPLGTLLTVVQVKRVADPTRTVGVDAVRALAGVRDMYPAAVAALVTNGRFSRSALEVAAQLPGLSLVDGPQLTEWLRRAG